MRTFITVKARKEGIHFWKDAPPEVHFLKNPHRHEFHFNVWIEVKHDDRELEFILVKRFIESVLPPYEWGGKSCEMAAQDLSEAIKNKYGCDRELIIEVLEDGENGSILVLP